MDARKRTRIFFGGCESTRHVICKARDAREARERIFFSENVKSGLETVGIKRIHVDACECT